jgi:glutathione S-transferase
MPQLRYTPNSPFARKVLVLAHELGMGSSIELVNTALRTEDPDFWRDNPLAKVPVWIGDDGVRLYDSNVICAYLNEVHGGGRGLPAPSPARWRDLSLIALADGMAEAGMLARQESSRAAGTRNETRIAQEMAKVTRGLDFLDREFAATAEAQGDFGRAAIAIACSLGWIELRFGTPFITDGRQALGRWWLAVNERPSLAKTRPQKEG